MIAASADIDDEIAMTRIDGRDVVIVAYSDGGFSGVRMLTGNADRAAAVDIQSGEIRWDSALPGNISLSRVLAAGEKYAYLTYMMDTTTRDT